MGLFSKKKKLSFYDDAVQEEIERILGPHDSVFHAPVPFDMGYDIGGRSDVPIFENHVPGLVYITSDLIGRKQKKSDAGNYELMICHREKETEWGVQLISTLAYYTLQAPIFSKETMGLEGGPFLEQDSVIRHILFDKYAEFTIENEKLGIMLLIGITHDEWEWGRQNSNEHLIQILKDKEIYPFTDMNRKSVI
jgi:hypothetical protein